MAAAYEYKRVLADLQKREGNKVRHSCRKTMFAGRSVLGTGSFLLFSFSSPELDLL
jgi:hypothetical protein